MRPFALALLALAFSAGPAHAAVIEIEDHFCGCDGSTGESDTRGIVLTANPAEANVITVRRVPRGIVIEDTGAPLTGRCRVARGGGRFCRGEFDGVDVLLGDGDDRLDHSTAGGTIEGGPGDDDLRVTTGMYLFAGGPGADRMDATDALGASVSYADHADNVTLRLNGIADDGAAGEGDNVIGPVTGLTGGTGDDLLEAGPSGSGLFGGDGSDTLVGSPERDTVNGGEGDDELLGGDGGDYLTGAGGADVLSGGPGLDEVAYGGSEPLHLSIGDGANDGASGEGDDIREDVEGLSGGSGDDVLIGDDDGNRLIAYGGRDVLRAGGGDDQLIGWNDGDELDAGPGADSVDAGALDRPLLADGERDRLNCRSRAPLIEADAFDVLRSCAPRVRLSAMGPVRRGRVVPLAIRCPSESAVACEGYVVVHLRRGEWVARRIRFGPIRPGARTVVALRIRASTPRGACLSTTAVTVRPERREAFTATPGFLRCLPR